ncbi:MAG TPA: UDP-2,4-diacetamido-2,4,6-trideoxy-beta-L-altropyranose hydrolase [Candidatus Deferrimicrobium sp.]|nr:UDP-2,4-diacetamido-2,4,6-trideoxy-beta-L-altropyranose hydrolase [Candidatus Deferrimicrobium sp.]
MVIKPKLPPLLVRADADGARGIGHVLRSWALAHAWLGQGGAVDFLTSQPPPALRRRMELDGATVSEIVQPCPMDADLEATLATIACRGSDSAALPWVILDGYHFTPTYQDAIRRSGCRLLVIDDTAHLARYDADIVLNHGALAPRLDYQISADAWLLLGTRYALLRAEFERWREFKRPIPATARNILLTLGGADGGNLTVKVMDALALLKDRAVDVQVLAGPLNPHLDALRRHAAATPNMRIHTDVSDPSPLMAWADIAIAAAGTTAWELAFMQTPALLLVAAENQTGVAAGVAEFAAGQSLGRAETLRRDDIAAALRQLIDDPARRWLMAERGKSLVDGCGPARVLAAMRERQSFNRQSEFKIRRAGVGDALLLWQWANDPLTRRNSFSRAAISWDDHQAWCAKKFAAPDCRWWIMQIGDLPVAQIRYDRVVLDSGVAAEISFSVAPGFRGRRLGTRLLEATAPLAAGELAADSIQAVALQGNEASRRVFLKAGFVAAEARRPDGRLCMIFRRNCDASSARESHASLH